MLHRFTTLAFITALAALLGACDLLDEPCPEGYWRPRAMHECEPVPTFDAGTDAGVDAAVVDAGPVDAGVDDAAVDDAAVDDAAVADGSAPTDGAVDGSTADAAATDAGDGG